MISNGVMRIYAIVALPYAIELQIKTKSSLFVGLRPGQNAITPAYMIGHNNRRTDTVSEAKEDQS